MRARGTPITTTASGTVIRTGYTAGNGNYVRSNTITLFNSILTHVKILVRRGQHKSRGCVLVVGSTGLATGAHVCYRFGKWEASGMLKLKLPGGEPMKSANRFF
jgi:murein DD-endopeptidase MepM/ murein hydrolase activator NlpD